VVAMSVTGVSCLRRFLSRFSGLSLVLVCTGFSAFVLLLCVLAGLQFKRSTETVFYRQTENIAQMLLASFEGDSQRVDAVLKQIATLTGDIEISPDNATELHRLLRYYTTEPSIIGPGIVDRNGTLIASAIVDPVPNISLKDRAIFRVQAENPGESKLFISVPTQGPLTKEWSIQFSRPLRDKTGAFHGVVIASYRLSHFIELYEKLKISDRGLAGLTGKDGVVRIRSLSGSIGYGSAVSKMAMAYDRVIAGEKSGKFYRRGGPDDVTRIGTFLASDTFPFYVTVGYDEDYLRSQYIGFFYALALFWIVLTAAMAAAAIFIRSLEKIRQRTQIEVVKSAIAERQNISADMHDSIGASLAALLAHFTADNFSLTEVKRRIAEILMELRFLVDSSEPIDGDLNLVLGNVRHRMGRGLELAGIELRWRTDDLPKLRQLTARDALSIKLILMEALSNVMHHSGAKSAVLMARYDEENRAAMIAIQDDGHGFDVNNVAAAGRGISNMRRRIATISTGGELTLESASGKGTIVRIKLNVPKSETYSAPLRENAA